MADTAHAEHGPTSTSPYMKVFYLLCIFTALSFVVNYFVREGHLSSTTGFILILSVAVVKALLVVCIFMHLKWDWGRLYFMIIPALVLAPMLVFALLPDIVLYWKHVQGWNIPAK
jgi:caa(3)-type oxidase subunit IV